MSTQSAIRAALPAISVIVSRPTSGRPSRAAEVPNPVMYTAGNPASSTSRAASGSKAPGATIVCPVSSSARSRAGPPGRRVSRAVIAPLADSGERARLAVVPAGVQRDDQPVPDRDDVIGTVVPRAAEVPAEPRRSHHQDHLVTGGDDLLKLGSEPHLNLVAQRLLQCVAATAGLRLRIFMGRIQVGPLQARVHELHHARDVTPVVGQEGIAYDPLALVTHLGR